MSSGHCCLIRDLGLVKGGKGLRHHEVVLELSLRGLFRFVASRISFGGGAERGKETVGDRSPVSHGL